MTTAPGIINQELKTANQPISADDASVAGFMGATERGPLATPTLVRSFKEFKDIFGSFQATSDTAYAVESFFAAGGKKAYISRVAEYTDISDASTAVGAASTLTLTDGSTPIPADTLIVNAKSVGLYGNKIKAEVVSNPLVQDYSIVAPMVSGASGVLVTSLSKISVGQALEVARGADATDLNSAIRLVKNLRENYTAHIADTPVHFAPDTDPNSALDSPALDSPTNTTELIATLSDLAGKYTNHIADLVSHNSADTINVLDTSPAGILASMTDLPGAIAAVNHIKSAYIGHLSAAPGVHSAQDTVNIIVCKGYGKVQSTSTEFIGGEALHTITFTAGVSLTGAQPISFGQGVVNSLEFDLNLYYDGSLTAAETFSQMTMEEDKDNYALTVVNDTAAGSLLIAVVDAGSASGVGLDTPAALTPIALVGGGAPDAALALTDYTGNSVSGLGVNAFDAREDVRLLIMPPNDSGRTYEGLVINTALEYCSARKDLFLIAEVDPSLNAAQAVAARNAAGYNNSFGALYYGRVEVIDNAPSPATPTKYITPVGYIAGKYAFVDSMPGGGTWNVAAGESPYGNMPGAISVEKSFGASDRALLNEASINIMRDRASKGILIYGARTLSEELAFRYINVRRLFLFVQQSIANSVEGTLFRNNSANTWKQLKSTIDRYLSDLFAEGALKGNRASEAYFVKVGENDGVQTPTDTDNGRLLVEIGLAAQKPAEFLIFRYSQYDGGNSIA